MMGVLFRIERQKLKLMKKGRQYTIQKMIIPTQACILPPHQKNICSNKTLMKIERGEEHKDDLVYFNIAINLHRGYVYNVDYYQILNKAADKFLENLYNFHYNKVMNINYSLKRLKESNLLYYHETALQLQACIDFVYLNKKMDIYLFQNLKDYFSHLSDELQLVFGYTLCMYFYHLHLSLTTLSSFLDYAKQQTYSGHVVIQELTLFYYITKNQPLEFIQQYQKSDECLSYYKYLYILHIAYEYTEVFDLKNLSINPLLKEEIYGRIGFFLTLKKNYNQAFDYFQKCHSIALLKFLPCLYRVSQTVQPTLWKLKKYLSSVLCYRNNPMIMLFESLVDFNAKPSKKTSHKIISLITEKHFPIILYHYHSPYHSFMKEFFYLLLIELYQTKSHD